MARSLKLMTLPSKGDFLELRPYLIILSKSIKRWRSGTPFEGGIQVRHPFRRNGSTMSLKK